MTDSTPDAKVDRFASLFSPATPPASPILAATQVVSVPSRPSIRQRHHAASTDSDDFGAFVSVSSTEDPLAFVEFSPIIETSRPLLHAKNSSLHFFDKIAKEAKAASDRKRKNVLDELLEHQDDPLYWLKAEEGNVKTDIHDAPMMDLEQHVPQLDQDIDTLTLGGPQPLHGLPHADDIPRRESPTSDPVLSTTPTTDEASRVGSITSSRWMHTLVSSSRPSPPMTTPTQSLDTLFAVPSYNTDGIASGSAMVDAKSILTTRAHVARSPPIPVPRPIPRPHPIPQISHGTPFGPHPFTPPTGAPGFGGDRKWDKGFSEDAEKEGTLAMANGVRLEGRKEGTTQILNVALAQLIRPHLPALSRLPTTWTLLYSLDEHGISLNTLYTRCDPSRQSPIRHMNRDQTLPRVAGALVVIKDEGETSFGAWIGDGVKKGGSGYYGSGESFLWTYGKGKGKGKGEGEGELKVFKWTGKNDYVALCEPDYISFGGGDGHYGLYLDDTLLNGTSARCPTFDNEPLCSMDGDPRRSKGGGAVAFECVGLEVWGVGP